MKRGSKIAIALLLGLIALLVINTLVVDAETKDAGVSSPTLRMRRLAKWSWSSRR